VEKYFYYIELVQCQCRLLLLPVADAGASCRPNRYGIITMDPRSVMDHWGKNG
jgi:hypothetical protein